MKRAWIAGIAFFTIIAVVFAALQGIGASTKLLLNGDALPQAYGTYLLDGRSNQKSETTLYLRSDVKAELSLVLCDYMDSFVYVKDSLVVSPDPNRVFSRLKILPIDMDLVRQQGQLSVRFRSGRSDEGIPSGKALLMTSARAEMMMLLSFGFTMFQIGAFCILILGNLVLYGRKPTERYLLTFIATTITAILTTLLASPISLLPISVQVYRLIWPTVVMLPVLMILLVCMDFLRQLLPKQLKWLLHPAVFVLSTVFILFLQNVNGQAIYYAIQALILLPMLLILCKGYASHVLGSLSLIIGYAVWQAFALRVCTVNDLHISHASVWGIFIRITQIGHLFFLCACLIAVNRRYAGKFDEAECLNKELDARVEERTQELVLAQSQRRMMMNNVFHDLRSPVFALSGMVEALIRTVPDERETLEHIRSRIVFLQRLISDLFTLSQLEEGKLRFDGDYVELSEILQAQLESMEEEARHRGIALRAEMAETAIIWGDGFRMEQIIQNLLQNAITYAPEGSAVDAILSVCQDEAQLKVHNGGEPIPKEDFPRVFERYYSVSRGKNKESTGLGLAIVQNLVQLHKGQITVESSWEEGTSFIVRLPLVPIKEQDSKI